jgi:hypothetical protein
MSVTLVNWARQAAIDLVSTAEEVRRRAEEPVEFGGYKFSAPKPYFDALIPQKAGLFVIQVRRWRWTRRVYKPIHVGESENLYEALLVSGEKNVVRWLMHPRTDAGLYVSVLATPLMNRPLRENLRDKLVRQYVKGVDPFVQGFRAMESPSTMAVS